MEALVDSLDTEVGALLASGQPTIVRASGTYNGNISSTTYTTLSGSEATLVATTPGTLLVRGGFHASTSFCDGDLQVDVVDSTGAVVGSSVAVPFDSGRAGYVASHATMSITAAGTYTARIRYNGGGTGSGNCYIRVYETSAVLFPSW